MPAQYRVVHRTEYEYGLPMADGFTTTHLEPRPRDHQRIVSFDLRVEPQPDEIERSLDALGNPVTRFAVHRPHTSLVVESTLVVDVGMQPVPSESSPWGDIVAAARAARGDLASELGPYLAATGSTPWLPALAELTDPEFVSGRPLVEAVSGLCRRMFAEFAFDAGFSDVTTPLADVFVARRGVCQDFAHVACAALRSIGVPARYVSGYIETSPPPGEPKLVGVDASHAWCAVWSGELGWLDFDPTNNQMPPMNHVTVGWGRDYDDVAPVRGVVIGPSGSQTLTVSVDVLSENRQ
jgi:transglutaminase-like putative cysteine protease